MRSEHTTSSSGTKSTNSADASTRSGLKSGKAPASHDHEAVQRFRKLMDGKTSGKPQDDNEAGEFDDLSSAASKKLALEQEQALRELLQQQMDAAGGKAAVQTRDGSEGDQEQSDEKHDDSAGSGNLGMQIQQRAVQIAYYSAQQPTAATQSALTPALAELIERHVKQLLVPDATSRSSAQSREIMITLKDGMLPDTELWLSRTAKGWRLRADTRSPDAYRHLVDGAPQLIERFASSQLGELEVDPALLG